jgi:redox-sensing transcriptional repressor
LIGEILDKDDGQNVAIIGAGNLGLAIMKYFHNQRDKLRMVAAFDVDPGKVNTKYDGIPIYHIDEIKKIVKEKNISIGIIAVPGTIAEETAEILVESGIKGILNYTPRPVNVPDHIYLEEYDMVTSLEKVAYFAKNMNEGVLIY